MGAADVVPGVSGGTLALITGIYERLINAIASIDTKAVKLLLKADIKSAWKHIDGTFLLVLAGGILSAIFALAHLIEHLVESQPILVWSFFCGLILASILLLLRMVWPLQPSAILFILVGAALAFVLGQIRGADFPVSAIFIFLGGFIAISAMMLPGISGSFLLLMLGLYQPTLQAVTELNLSYIAIFGCGAAVGFLLFSRIIRFLLNRFHDRTLLFLTGLLMGSLYTIWPWKQPFDHLGVAQSVMPSTYAAQGLDAELGMALICSVLGFILVSVISIAGAQKDAASSHK